MGFFQQLSALLFVESFPALIIGAAFILFSRSAAGIAWGMNFVNVSMILLLLGSIGLWVTSNG